MVVYYYEIIKAIDYSIVLKIFCCNRQFSKGFIYCNSIIFHSIGIGKPAKRDVVFNLPLLCGLADGLDITADFKEAVEMHGGTVRPDSCFILCAEGQRIQIEEFDEDGGGPVLDVPAAKNEVRA